MPVNLNYMLTAQEETIVEEARAVVEVLISTGTFTNDSDFAVYLFRAGLARLTELSLQSLSPRIGIVNALVPLVHVQGDPE